MRSGDKKVMLDFDHATLYGTETKRLKEAFRRNKDRFPSDFMFELSRAEYHTLRTQFASLEYGKGKYSKYLPFAFTEQGVAMLSDILNSQKAVQVNIAIMRAFVLMRQYALSHKDLTQKLKELEEKFDQQFKDVYDAINFLLGKDNLETQQKEGRELDSKEIQVNKSKAFNYPQQIRTNTCHPAEHYLRTQRHICV